MALPMIETKIISSGCNRTNFALDWGHNGLISYGSCNCVVLYKPTTNNDDAAKILCTLVGHTKRVNCVKWVKGHDDLLVSGSVDKTAIVWRCFGTHDLSSTQYEIADTLRGHTGAITSLDAISTSNNTVVIATASGDFTVKIWDSASMEKGFTETQSLNYGSGFALDVCLVPVPNCSNSLLLACATTDHKIHLYTRSDHLFHPVMKLSGHEDWVRCVTFTVDNSNDLLLASSAQDHMIRVWRIKSLDTSISTNENQPYISDLPPEIDIKLREEAFIVQHSGGSTKCVVTLETVLSGHDNWVYSVCWVPPTVVDGSRHQEMCLLSASMDKTMIIWRPDVDSGIWMEQVRVGEVGGNTLGFYGGLFSPTGDNILAHGYQGAFHQWQLSKELDSCQPTVTVKGHFGAVVDISWDTRGQFLLSCSIDQTTRLYGPWVRQGTSVGWYEISRPQIHGYDMTCLTAVNHFCFASGADEKVIRIFEAPSNFVANFCAISDRDSQEDVKMQQPFLNNIATDNRHLHQSHGFIEQPTQSMPEGASVPALGLSNKAIFAGHKTDLRGDLNKMAVPDQMSELCFTPVTLKEPPTEEHLLQNTLWPETQKLYAHSYELFALAPNPAGTLLASASKATKPEYARIILWDTSSWRQACTLDGPSLTVTQMEFSHCGGLLVVVSRDRTWHLYSIQHHIGDYRLIAHLDKKTSIHGRIIWSCCWSHDDVFFATASRDKKVAVWRVTDQTLTPSTNHPCSDVLKTSDSPTAVAMAPVSVNNKYLVAVGLESGLISLHTWTTEPPNWTILHTLDHRLAHTLTVRRLRFCPVVGRTEERPSNQSHPNIVQLASCSNDHSNDVLQNPSRWNEPPQIRQKIPFQNERTIRSISTVRDTLHTSLEKVERGKLRSHPQAELGLPQDETLHIEKQLTAVKNIETPKKDELTASNNGSEIGWGIGSGVTTTRRLHLLTAQEYSTAESVMEERRRLLAASCLRLALTHNIHISNVPRSGNRLSFIPLHRHPTHMLYCHVPKVASTMNLQTIVTLDHDGARSSTGTRDPADVPPSDAYKLFDTIARDVTNLTRQDVASSTLKYMFVRNPYERLYSAYLDKFYSLKPVWYNFSIAITTFIRGPDNNSSCKNDVTFAEFIRHVIQTCTLNPTFADPHWKPHFDMCQPCLVNYDIIGKTETLSRDFRYVLERANVASHLKLGSLSSKNEAHQIDVSTWNVINTHNRFHGDTGCTAVLRVMERQWKVLQLRGIISDTQSFPLQETISLLKSITHLTLTLQGQHLSYNFRRMVNRATRKSVVSRTAKETIKRRALREAHASIPFIDLLAIRRLYYADFVLFGYNMDHNSL